MLSGILRYRMHHQGCWLLHYRICRRLMRGFQRLPLRSARSPPKILPPSTHTRVVNALSRNSEFVPARIGD
jgi:hypothetical protein